MPLKNTLLIRPFFGIQKLVIQKLGIRVLNNQSPLLSGFKLRSIWQNPLIIVFGLALAACGSEPESPEAQVKEVIKQIELAAQERSNSGIMQHISDAYQDHHGNQKDDIRKLVTVQLLRNQKISIFTLVRSIEIIDDTAQVELSAAISGRKVDLSDSTNRLDADVYRFSLLFTIESGDWRINSGSWERGW